MERTNGWEIGQPTESLFVTFRSMRLLRKPDSPMPYRLNPRLPLDKAVRNLARAEIRRMRGFWRVDKPASETLVHDTRKAVKRLRALLRLVRSGLSEDDWSEANGSLRGFARQLSTARDSEVRREVLTRLLDGAKGPLRKAVEHAAGCNNAPSTATCQLDDPAKQKAQVTLHGLARSLERLAIDPQPTVIGEGLERTHRRGRRLLQKARLIAGDGNPPSTTEIFHELRKTVQAHHRHMQLLADAWPALMQARTQAARALSQRLGDEHDLEMLVQWIASKAGSALASRDRKLVADACRDEQSRIQRSAIAEAARLFAAKPSHFSAEILATWGTACHAEPATRPVPSRKP